jgi:hypothetical protein
MKGIGDDVVGRPQVRRDPGVLCADVATLPIQRFLVELRKHIIRRDGKGLEFTRPRPLLVLVIFVSITFVFRRNFVLYHRPLRTKLLPFIDRPAEPNLSLGHRKSSRRQPLGSSFTDL